jgi:hypothetical protein
VVQFQDGAVFAVGVGELAASAVEVGAGVAGVVQHEQRVVVT